MLPSLFAVFFSIFAIGASWDWQPRTRGLVAFFCALLVLYAIASARELDEPEPPSFTGHRYAIGAVILASAIGYLAWWSGAFFPTLWQSIGLGLLALGIGFGVGYLKGRATLRRAGWVDR
jgi:hypothetical protein